MTLFGVSSPEIPQIDSSFFFFSSPVGPWESEEAKCQNAIAFSYKPIYCLYMGRWHEPELCSKNNYYDYYHYYCYDYGFTDPDPYWDVYDTYADNAPFADNPIKGKSIIN